MKLTAEQLKRIIKEEVQQASRRRVVEGYDDTRSHRTADAIQTVMDERGLSTMDYIDDVQDFYSGDMDQLFAEDPQEWADKVEELVKDILVRAAEERAEDIAYDVKTEMGLSGS